MNCEDLIKEHKTFINELNQLLKKDSFLIFNDNVGYQDIKDNDIHNTNFLNIEFIKSLFLKFKLINHDPKIDNINNIEDFTIVAEKYLKDLRFFYGYHKFEDSMWRTYRFNNNKKYEINSNEVVFDNTICVANKNDNDIIYNIELIKSFLLKISDKIKCDIKFIYETKFDVVNICLLCRYE